MSKPKSNDTREFWVQTFSGTFRCSKCEKAPFQRMEYHSVKVEFDAREYRYCPYCGVKMWGFRER